MITGANIAGGNGRHERIRNDFYATPPIATEKLITNHKFQFENVLEPCVGQGHIADVLRKYHPEATYTLLGLTDRGYPGTIKTDFLQWENGERFDTIITNPPYTIACDFIRKSYGLLTDEGQLAVFLKIQFLEGVCRRELFDQIPPVAVYVFRQRISAWNNGLELNPDTGKPWSSTITFAWFVWQKGSRTEPVIRWA